MSAYFFIIQIVLLHFLFTNAAVKSDSPCGDWEVYKEEKCLKIFEEPGLVTYEDAENFCKVEQEAHLITIGIEEEQKYIEELLKKNQIADNIWIGLKYTNSGYQWADDTPLHYTNWATGSPKNDSEHCVQIQTDETEFGLWSDVLCTKKNLIICEKIQLWSALELQSMVMNLMKNPVPIGFIYVQLPKEKAPSDIWSWMKWEDVSSDYAGVFFRVLGGDSESFGSVQKDNTRRLTHIHRIWDAANSYDDFDLNPGVNGAWDVEISAYRNGMAYFTVSGGEIRPINMAIRIWKRTL